MVDFVRIQWNSEVEMLGETSNFNNPHFFSAAKVDGKWYYYNERRHEKQSLLNSVDACGDLHYNTIIYG